MDDIKQFAKNEKELKTVIQAVKIYSNDMRMEFEIEKCARFITKNGKRQMTEGIELPNQEKIRTHEKKQKKTYKYLGIWEAETYKQVEMKKKMIFKNTSGERQNYSKPNYIAEISLKRKIPGLSFSSDTRNRT